MSRRHLPRRDQIRRGFHGAPEKDRRVKRQNGAKQSMCVIVCSSAAAAECFVYLMSVSSDGDTESSGKTEVSELKSAMAVNQKVLGLEVAVEDAAAVAEGNTLEKLVHVGLHEHRLQLLADGVHVLLEVLVKELEDQVQLLLGVENILKADDVRVLQLAEEGDLANGSAGNTFILGVQAGLLESHKLLSHLISCHVNNTVGTFSDFLELLVTGKLGLGVGLSRLGRCS